ncbi:hypothetical protein C8Q80DRAFT_1104403 [Daedaleopsis nitida]|nr:hypothetical protein C8Q80DRAFT_1104403 [Daedaleopsis nitida]
MDGPLKELAKLEKLAAGAPAGKGKAPSIDQSLDALLDSLRNAKERFATGTGSQATLAALAKTVEDRKKEMDERQKDLYNAAAKVGKALDKKFTNPLPSYEPLFVSPQAKASLERIIAVHFLRTGQFDTAETFISESDIDISFEMRAQFVDLHRIMLSLKGGDISPALDWTHRHREFLHRRSSSLEFHLHRFQYLRLLLSHPPDVKTALAYAQTNFSPFFEHHGTEVRRLMTCVLFLPMSRLMDSPYGDLVNPSVHTDLQGMFATEYCASLGMSRQAPLRVIGDIGGGGALARIEKGRKVMRERKSEWSQTDELPIEIPLPAENRYHSIFACPVSKEQSTEANPPMMMACGHVITKESLQKLSKPGGRVSDLTDEPHSLGITAPELAGLSAEEIDFIDDVISRAPTTASTFLPVFKAYNDVMQERGIDPQNEVVYYTKLLKIGTLKGMSWSDKWSLVKEQQGYVGKANTSTRGGRKIRVPRTTPTPAKPTTKSSTRVPYVSRVPDTLAHNLHHEHSDHTEDELYEPSTPLTTGRPYSNTRHPDDTPRPRRRFGSPPIFDSTTNTLGLDTGPPSSMLDPVHVLDRISARVRDAVPRWDAETTAETTTQVSSIPPSYGAAVREEPISPKEKGKGKELPPPRLRAKTTQVLSPRDWEKYAVDPQDPFEKIRRERDEEMAARIYNDRLLERCYEVWRQGYDWIISTGDQIAEARDMLILRRAFQRWRQHTGADHELYQRVAALSDRRCLKRSFQIWKLRLKEKKQGQWREGMRARMKLVRERDERRLKKEMWAKWRQSYLTRLSEQQFSRKVVGRFFKRWKIKVKSLDQLEAAADHFIYNREADMVDRYWESWRRAAKLRRAERIIRARVELRIMVNAIDVWRQNHQQYHVAERFHDALVVKHALQGWKTAQARIKACLIHCRSMERRASKYIARQDDVLVRAIMRIWKARERGKLLTRVQTVRSLKQAWAVWKRKMQEQREQEEMAQLFRTRSSSLLAASVLKRWREVYRSHQNAQTFAVQYHRAQLQYKMLFAWRLQLRAKLRMVKQAKVAQKYLLVRRCFKVWTAKVAEKKRLQKLQELELRVAKRYFEEWRRRVHEERAVKRIRKDIAMRNVSNALMHWTTRVADSKLRELETDQAYDKRLIVRAYNKWKAIRKRHCDDLSLMQSYQDVKREESMRKMFYRWLVATRTTRRRRLQLQAKEEQFQFTVIAGAWDKWRERFQDIRLQPLANAFIKQHQSDLLFRTYAAWHSKSRSLPAVRFHATNLKARFWKQWRALMPKAIQAKSARETDRHRLLKKAFSIWRERYTVKLRLKAINRARWIGPSPEPLHVPQTSTLAPQARNSLPLRPWRRTIPNDAGDDDEAEPPPATSASRTAYTRPLTVINPTRIAITSLAPSQARRPSPSPECRPRSSERRRPFSSRRTGTAPREPSPSETTEAEPAPPAYRKGIEAWRKEVRPNPPPPKSAPPSVMGDAPAGGGRGSLWEELKEVRTRRRSRAPTERTYSPEPL